MNNNEVIMLNDVTRIIYTMKDFGKMRLDFLKMITLLIPNRYSSFFLASGDPGRPLTDPVGVGIDLETLNWYADELVESDYTRWHFMSGKSMVYRETDLFPDDFRERTDYFNYVFKKHDSHYSAQMGIGYAGIFLGVVSLFRSLSDGDFTDHELFLLDLTKDHMEYRLYQEWSKEKGKYRDEGRSFDANEFIRIYGLTIRESEVLLLLLDGLTNESVCSRLMISGSTLKKHCLNIYKKLEVNNRWELIRFK